MSAQSDRIRAALSRSEAARPAAKAPSIGPLPPNLEAELPAIAVNTENLEALLRSDAPAIEPRILGSSTEIEDTLRLIAATDEERVSLSSAPSSANKRVVDTRRASLTPLFVAFALILALAGMAAYFYRDRWLPTPRAVAAWTVQDGTTLGVSAEPQSNGLTDVRWNAQSPEILQAREGRLVVQERDQEPRVVPLSPEQLRIGHLSFPSTSESLEVRLEVADAKGATLKDSVLALSSKAIPTPQPDASSQSHVEAPLALPSALATASVEAPTPPAPSRPVARAFTPPVQEPRAAIANPILEPATVTAMGPVSAPAAGFEQSMGTLPGPPPPARPQPAALVQTSAPAPALRVGGKVQEANLIKKVAPIYPQAAKFARISGTVRFEATISKSGSIQNLRVLEGNVALVRAATEAVKQWVYRPMMLDGEPIEVVTQIDVTFSLN